MTELQKYTGTLIDIRDEDAGMVDESQYDCITHVGKDDPGCNMCIHVTGCH